MATLLAAVETVARRLHEADVAFGHGTQNADDEAAWLVLWALGLPLDALASQADRPVEALEQARIDALVDERIRRRIPTAYLTGEAWLQGVPFDIDPGSIVPRSLIAELIADGSLEPWLPPGPMRVLDLCTGNASLAVLAALAWPCATIDASDVSVAALEVGRRNVARHALQGRITLWQSDLFDALPADTRYDLILCNPPYVNAASMAALPPEFRAEPALALAGGVDGMDLVRRIVTSAASYLAPHGALVLEIGHECAHFEAAFPRLEALWLETSGGPDMVLLLTRDTLLARH